MNLAAHFADQVLLMKEGKMVAIRQAEEVLTIDLLRQVFEVEVLVDAHPVTVCLE